MKAGARVGHSTLIDLRQVRKVLHGGNGVVPVSGHRVLDVTATGKLVGLNLMDQIVQSRRLNIKRQPRVKQKTESQGSQYSRVETVLQVPEVLIIDHLNHQNMRL